MYLSTSIKVSDLCLIPSNLQRSVTPERTVDLFYLVIPRDIPINVLNILVQSLNFPRKYDIVTVIVP